MLIKKVGGMIRLFRPELPLAAGICVITGQVLALGGLPGLPTAILGFVCVFCLSSAALILNDLFDYEVDLINAPQRPLPSGAVSRADVIGLTILTTLIGLSTALALGIGTFIVGVILWIVGFLYNWRYKQTGLPGNLMVSVSVAGTFLFGGISVGAPWNATVWIFSFIAFFVDLGEEIAGDAMDMEGDKQRGSRSLALLKGKRFALRVTAVCWSLVIMLSLLPAVLGLLGITYLIFILVTDGVLVFFTVRLLKSRTPAEGRRAMRGAYLGASLGVLAFLIGLLAG